MELQIHGVDGMLSFGKRLGAALSGGEFIELVGDVGAGKTTLTKGLALGLGIEETIQSPTFTISRTYDTPDGRQLVHYDFYRLQDAGIMSDELSESAADDSAIVVVEWADAVRGVIPTNHLRISFQAVSDDDRLLTITTEGGMADDILGKVNA